MAPYSGNIDISSSHAKIMSEQNSLPHLKRHSTATSVGSQNSISLDSDTPSRSKGRHDNNFQTHEELFDQHNVQIQQIFDNRHHDINFDDDGTASFDDSSFGNSSLSSLDDASLNELRAALIARRQRYLDEGGSVGKRHRRGRSLDRSIGSLSFASLTESLTSLTRRRKKKPDKDAKSKKKKKEKKRSSTLERERKKTKKKKSKDKDASKKSKDKHDKDNDGGSLKVKQDKKKRSTNSNGAALDNSTLPSRHSWDPAAGGSKLNIFSIKSPLGTKQTLGSNDFLSQSARDSDNFVFYACDENTGCCAL
jgi:hypothetical protein